MEDKLPATRKTPQIQELYSNLDIQVKHDDLSTILNYDPPSDWVKTHPYIKNWRYLPIDKIEFLLQRLFKFYRINIIGEGTAFNGVYVKVRVEYMHPVTEKMEWHDGIGAMQLQTSKGTSPAQLENINNGAISMAFPIAKALAIKDATDHIGRVFGRDLNRKDVLPFTPDEKLRNHKKEKEIDRLSRLIDACEGLISLDALRPHISDTKDDDLMKKYEAKRKAISNTSPE